MIDVEILVLGPARRAHDEADGLGVNAEPREQRLPVAARARCARSGRTPRPDDRTARARWSTPNRLSRNAARPRDTHRFASTRRASRRSSHRASRTAGCQWPRRSRSSVYPRLCQSMTNRTPRRRSAHQVTANVGNAGGFWTRTRSGRGSCLQRPPQPKAQPRGIEQPGDRIARSVQAAAESRKRVFLMRWTVMRGSPVTRLGSGVPSRPTRSTSTPFDDQRVRVVLHAGASPEIAERDNGGSHSGMGLEGGINQFNPPARAATGRR